MRLATLEAEGQTFAAVVDGERAAPIEDRSGHGFGDLGELLRADDSWPDLARQARERGDWRDFAEEAVRRPVLEPAATFCVGLNYRSHLREMGRELPEHPTLFSKLARSLTDPFAPISVPSAGADAVDYEGEIVAVIGRPGRNVAAEDGWDLVAGLTVMNDVSMRDFQRRSPQWFAGKTWEECTPVGPWLTTLEEIEDLSSLQLRTSVNGEQRQVAQLGDMVHDIPALIADISRIVTLQPGDLIATGTPGGVGEARGEGEFLTDGDTVEIVVDQIGALHNTFRVEAGR